MRLRSCEPSDAEAVLELWNAARAGGSLADTVDAILDTEEQGQKFWTAVSYDHDTSIRRYVRNI